MPVAVTLPAHLSHTGRERSASKPIDSCIAGIVRALNDQDILTDSSCCGHGKEPGRIDLRDGRVIRIAASTGDDRD